MVGATFPVWSRSLSNLTRSSRCRRWLFDQHCFPFNLERSRSRNGKILVWINGHEHERRATVLLDQMQNLCHCHNIVVKIGFSTLDLSGQSENVLKLKSTFWTEAAKDWPTLLVPKWFPYFRTHQRSVIAKLHNLWRLTNRSYLLTYYLTIKPL